MTNLTLLSKDFFPGFTSPVFFLECFYKTDQAIFHLVMKLVQFIVFLTADLAGDPEALIARMEFTTRAQCNIQQV